jgi:hypothetical protein
MHANSQDSDEAASGAPSSSICTAIAPPAIWHCTCTRRAPRVTTLSSAACSVRKTATARSSTPSWSSVSTSATHSIPVRR